MHEAAVLPAERGRALQGLRPLADRTHTRDHSSQDHSRAHRVVSCFVQPAEKRSTSGLKCCCHRRRLLLVEMGAPQDCPSATVKVLEQAADACCGDTPFGLRHPATQQGALQVRCVLTLISKGRAACLRLTLSLLQDCWLLSVLSALSLQPGGLASCIHLTPYPRGVWKLRLFDCCQWGWRDVWLNDWCAGPCAVLPSVWRNLWLKADSTLPSVQAAVCAGHREAALRLPHSRHPLGPHHREGLRHLCGQLRQPGG